MSHMHILPVAPGTRRAHASSPVRILVGVALLLAVLLLSACTPNQNSTPGDRGEHVTNSAEKTGDGKTRSDLQPLTDRFPALAAAESATWLSGTMGSSDAPGPSTYWIDAVVVLPPAEHAALKDLGTGSGAQLPEGFSAGLANAVPAGTLLGSTELTALFSQNGFSSAVVLVDDGRTLILSSLFE